MLNQIVLVGKLTKEPTIENEEREKAIITLSVPRSFKNVEGEYETDFIPCVLWGSVAKNVIEYCRVGEIIGIRGRIQANENIEIIAEKVTFLSSKSSKE